MLNIEDLNKVSDCIDEFSQINIYPNPVKENLIIENNTPENHIIK